MGRPDGSNIKQTAIDLVMGSMAILGMRNHISAQITDQLGVPRDKADLPSQHLRFGLRQMKLKGWTNEKWGDFDGDGPICILESVKGLQDAPGGLRFESLEQKYIRLAFKQLTDEGAFTEVPVYISEWNDEQDDFAIIEMVMLRAIGLAEEDEAAGDVTTRFPKDEKQLRDMFGLTPISIMRASLRGEQPTPEGQDSNPGSTPVPGGDGAGVGGAPVQGESTTFTAPPSSDLKNWGFDGTIGYLASE